jgi:6-pyruvoyltetrahydropterin/6-carboxytetrahydropterin synthase
MYLIRKAFTFEAGHHLNDVPEGHKCGGKHGHSYKIYLFLESEDLDSSSFVVDFGALKAFSRMYIDWPKGVDHRYLNDLFPWETTAENLAEYFYGKAKAIFPQVVKVGVRETETGYAEYWEK